MKTIAGIIFAMFVLLVVALLCANAIASAGELPTCNAETARTGQLCLLSPGTNPAITTVHGDGTVTPAPLSAIAVTQCGLAVSLFIQLDATHLLRADPRQSDMFTNVDGKMVQSQAGPMTIDQALTIAERAVLSTHVVLPCTDGPTV